MRLEHADLRATYEALLGRYLPALRRLASAYVRTQAERDDLLQEIAMALWTALPRFRGDSSERTWLYRVAHNTAIRYSAYRSRRQSRESAEDAANYSAPSPSPEKRAIEEQQRAALHAAIADLGVIDRQVVMLHLEGLSASEIESITGLSAGAVATRLTRARQKLMARVRGENDE